MRGSAYEVGSFFSEITAYQKGPNTGGLFFVGKHIINKQLNYLNIIDRGGSCIY